MTTFNGQSLFSSGPHRVHMGPRAQSLVPNYQLGEPGAGTTLIGPLEWEIIIEGRLIASTRSSLWSLRDALTELIGDEPAVATLVLSDGTTFDDMTFTSYTETAPIAQGRVWSVGYKAVFRKRK